MPPGRYPEVSASFQRGYEGGPFGICICAIDFVPPGSVASLVFVLDRAMLRTRGTR